MKILFLGFQDLVQPWYDDFYVALEGKHDVRMYDPALPLKEQFQVDIVVDQGGWGTHDKIDAAAAAGVKLWQIIGTGLNHTHVDYILSKGIMVSHSPGYLSGPALAEHALFLMFCFAKKLSESNKNVNSARFYHPLNDELGGQVLGLIGLGGSGRELAKRAWALGMRIQAIDIVDVPKTVLDEHHVEFFGKTEALDKVVSEADYLSIHVPLTSKTEKLIDKRALGKMKPTAVLINVARGEIVDEVALLEALQKGAIRGAGLDVFWQEPLDPKHPFLHMPNVVATPHVAGGTRGTSQRRGKAAAENCLRVAKGLPPIPNLTSGE